MGEGRREKKEGSQPWVSDHNCSNHTSRHLEMLAVTGLSAPSGLLSHGGILSSLNVDTLPLRSLGLIIWAEKDIGARPNI